MLIILSEKLLKINPFAGINSGKCIIEMIESVFQHATEIVKIRTMIPIIAISLIRVLSYYLSSTMNDDNPKPTLHIIITIIPMIRGFLRPLCY